MVIGVEFLFLFSVSSLVQSGGSFENTIILKQGKKELIKFAFVPYKAMSCVKCASGFAVNASSGSVDMDVIWLFAHLHNRAFAPPVIHPVQPLMKNSFFTHTVCILDQPLTHLVWSQWMHFVWFNGNFCPNFWYFSQQCLQYFKNKLNSLGDG